MSRFQQDMETCAARAQDTEAKFDALVKCAGELSLAMADGMGKSSPNAFLRHTFTYRLAFSNCGNGKSPDSTERKGS